MQPLKLLKDLQLDMVEYISSKYPFFERGRTDLNEQLVNLMSQPGTLFQDPVIQLVRKRKSVEFDPSLFSRALHAKLPPTPYSHQIQAWQRINSSLPTVVSTGTGSGKSESFMFPVVDGLIKAGFPNSNKGVGALCLYPMNALVEDQFFRFLKLTEGTGLKVGIYNGTFKRLSPEIKKKIFEKAKAENKHIDEASFFVDPDKPETIPHILLTNYKMLEYMLLRTRDHRLFEGADLRYLTLDEAHTYTGTLGLEIACLLTRLRVHLGDACKKFVPIATSATLAQEKHGIVGEPQSQGKDHKQAMREFFSQLFGTEFPDDGRWLIEDEFEDLPALEPLALKPLVAKDTEQVHAALKQSFPDGLAQLARIYFDIKLADPSGFAKLEEFYDAWAKQLYPHMQRVAPQIARILLVDDDGAREKTVIPFEQAKARFAEVTGADPAHLEALLILASQAYEKSVFPALGIRVHVFGRSEPRLYWSLNGKTLMDEAQAQDHTSATAAFVSCRKCGHMAWAGVYTPTSDFNGQGGRFDKLPAFYEDAKLTPGAEIIVLHRAEDVQEEIVGRKDWSLEHYEIDIESPEHRIRFLTKGNLNGPNVFVRIKRKDSKGEWAEDMDQCPSCGSTSNAERQSTLMTPRSGAATDISVYSASMMTHLDLAHERRLLVFCDNRQETAFLAGFLTDRHRRFNLRRAIASFLMESANHQDGHDWKLLADIDEEEQPKGHKYDFAARVLLSILKKQYYGKEELPDTCVAQRQILTEIIPRDVLEVDYWYRKNSEKDQVNEWKNWLLGNISIVTNQKNADAKEVFDTVELFDTDRGQWCLKTLHEVILLEISAMVGREGNLRSLGLASWSFPFLKVDAFKEWAESRPELNIGPMGLFVVSHWLISRLAENGQWQGMDPSSRRHVLGRRGKSDFMQLDEFFGKGFDTDKGISKNSQIARLLLHFGGETGLSIWSRPGPWLEMIDKGPLKKVITISRQDGFPRLATERSRVISNPVRYRGKLSGIFISADASTDLQGQPTGRKDDIWEKTDTQLHNYYKVLYQRPFDEESRLVRAHEHNGMLGGDIASEVIQRFENDEINTLVATPTLEMGVDLPDLPIVIHRSVPPDASNYAQRAGRAGRGPKRALIVTHCGFGSHDLTFYEDPEQMVSGEILPPGLPRENLSIIERHVQGLILEVLAKEIAAKGSPIRMDWWGDLVDLNPLRQELLRYAGDSDQFPEASPCDWQDTLGKRRNDLQKALEEFVTYMKSGLWQGMGKARVDDMARRLLSVGEPNAWADRFREELAGYFEKAKTYVDDFVTWMQRPQTMDSKKRAEIIRQQDRAFKIAKLYVTKSDQNYPLSYLGMTGFLPNFDFPGKSIRFVGVLPQFMDKKMAYANWDDRYLTFSRGASVALREFAPEQKVYGQGFIYKVDRYEAETREVDSGKAWGVCTKGCMQLSAPGNTTCEFCGSELVNSGREAAHVPTLVEISGVQGIQAAVISDRESKRSFNRMVKEIRHLGIPEADERYALMEVPDVSWQIHSSLDNQIKIVTLLSGSVVKMENGEQSLAIVPVYKEMSDGQNRVFKVKASLTESDDDSDVRYEEFLPAIWGKGQAIVFRCPFSVADGNGWICPESLDEETLESYYKTIAHLISRASTRVLRLNKRKASLQFLDHRVNEQMGDGKVRVAERALLILDADEGGSGVIPLLWDYWDQIMDEAERLVTKPCCVDGCYECIKSYDNQFDHARIRKSIFYTDKSGTRSAPIFHEWKKFHDGKQRFQHVHSMREARTDENSPAEKSLEEFLRLNFPQMRKTQASVNDHRGREITRPDFILPTAKGDEIVIFVDGWTYHHTTIRADLSKRNALAKQGRRVAALPGALLVPRRRDDCLQELQGWLTNADNQLLTTGIGDQLSDMPFACEAKDLRSIHTSTIKPTAWLSVDGKKVKTEILSRIKAAHFKQAISSIDLKHFPVGEQNGFLLWPIFVDELESEDNKRLWESVLVLQAILASWGYANLMVPAKSLKKGAA